MGFTCRLYEHIEFEHIMQHTRNIIEKIQIKIQEVHNRKINNLLTRRNVTVPTPTHKFHTRTVNTTSTNFTNAEINLLAVSYTHLYHFSELWRAVL